MIAQQAPSVDDARHTDQRDMIAVDCAREISLLDGHDTPTTSSSRRQERIRRTVATSVAEQRLADAAAIWTFPEDPEPADLMLDGILLHADGDPDAALQRFRAAGHRAPVDWKPLALQGWVQEQSGRQRHAIQCYRNAMTLDRSGHASTLALCRLLLRLGRLPMAVSMLQTALANNQRNPQINRELARLYERRASINQKRGRTEVRRQFLQKASRHYQVAFEASGDSSARVAQAMVLRQMGDHESSKRLLQQAVDQMDGSQHHAADWARTLLASEKLDSGDLSEASRDLLQVLSSDPHRAVAHFRYARSLRFSKSDATDRYLDSLLDTLARPDLKRRDEILCRFALGKVQDDLGNHEQAWDAYRRGNELKLPEDTVRRDEKRERLERRMRNQVEMYQGFFHGSRIEAYQRGGHETEQPIFIVGMPRSGTTLTEHILSCHPEVSAAGELKDIENMVCRFRNACSGRAEPSLRKKQANAFSRHGKAGLAAMLPLRNDEDDDGTRDSGFGESNYPQAIADLSDELRCGLADFYLDSLRQSADATSRRITDKMPTNFWHLGWIAALMPNAKIVHCRRHPLDTLVSSLCQNLSFPYCDPNAWTSVYLAYQTMMRHWESVMPHSILSIDYEQLVCDPKPTIERMLAHCSLDWDDACLSSEKNTRAVHTPSKWQVRQPIYQSSMGKWQRFDRHLEDVRDRLGI